jgi:hypothetical protein
MHRCDGIKIRSYAVGSKSGVHLDERPDSPPAGRKTPSLFTKKSQSEFFCEQDKKRTMLPPAILPFTG